MRADLLRAAPGALLFAVGAGCTADSVQPTPPAEPLHFVTLATGLDRTCGIDGTGTLFCWGRRLGGDTLDVPTPRPQAVPLPAAATAVAVGDEHSCVALVGGAACWGDGAHGRIGGSVGGFSQRPAPLAVPLDDVSAVRVGGGHSCARGQNGRVYCWGRGVWGELGTGRIEETAEPAEFGAGLYRFATVATGEHHTCAIDLDGRVLCTGWGAWGQLGVDATVNLGFPERVASAARFSGLAAGRHHTCGLDVDGRAFCWGRGDGGQLGDGLAAHSAVPVEVGGGHRFRSITAGSEHTCAVTESGQAYCWGLNRFGRLGNGRMVGIEPVPVQVVGGIPFRSLEAGTLHTCGIAEAGPAYCWGFGGFGQLGTGSPASSAEPLAVIGPAS